MIILDYQDRRPIYEQIADRFRVLILRGALPSGSKMPSVRQLAMELSINPNTIQRAYMELEQEELIYPVKGKGNFVGDVEHIRKKSQAEFCREFKELTCKGREIGLTAGELTEIVETCYKEGRR